ncbi:MAG TPA: hypothetical protein VK623_07930 [Flavobacterium sp.]|nr:hypothetical protein [Flavobacterium sp.]
MKKHFKIIALLLTICISMNSCGVMFGGSRYNATIIAENHPQADIYVGGQKIGTGTAKGLYKRNKPLVVELREEGCENTTKTFDNMFRTGNFILSVITFGIVGIAVDLGTGAAYKPDHKHDKNIKKTDTKDFTFTVQSTCKK